MRCELWPDGTGAEHRDEIERFFRGEFPRAPWAVLVADVGAGRIVGFAEVGIRTFAEGCRSNHVAYLEGWFVDAGMRRRGVGQALVRAAESWGREQGCTEMASDTSPENVASLSAHRAAGFVGAGTVQCFRKVLTEGPSS